jgi:hypothetical protein
MKSTLSFLKPRSVFTTSALAAALAVSGAHAQTDQSDDATPTSTQRAVAQATATPSGTPPPQIDGEGTIAGPRGRQAQFFITDVENEQVTPRFLEGEFGYSDHKSRITFTTGRIQTVTINGNQGAFTGTAQIGGKHKQQVQFTVTVTANQTPATNDTFSIQLSNGYTASGSLTSGSISIRTLDPDPGEGGR